jgi:outer membrane protein insertion porin family
VTVWFWNVLAACLIACLAIGAAAQDLGTGTIRDVRVEGAQRVDPETVRSYMTLRAGDPFEAERIDRSLKTLFGTGLFADVTLRREGDALIVRVVENPIINRIAFEGNKKIDDDALNAEVQLRPRVVFTRTKVQNDVRRILEVYRRSGRFAATVEPKVITLPQNRVDLVFEIDEGPVTYVKRIAFVGNKAFSARALRDVTQTKEEAWYRFLTSDDTYDPDRLTADRELLRRHYLKNGYVDFRIVSAVAELTPDRTGFFVTFTLEEGERYRFGKIDFASGLKNLDPETLRPQLVAKSGDWYDAEEIEESIRKITDHLGTLGFAFVEINPVLNRNRDTSVVDVTLDVREGPRVFVERIDIVGNARTLDRVIRREFRLVEGDAFNTAKLRRSRQRLQNLGFFNKVEVTNTPGSAPDKTVIKAEVQEKSTGEISFGAGVSTTDKVIGDIVLRERNLLGKGQDARIGFRISARRQEYDLSFTEPYFLDKNLAAGFDLFRTTRDNQRESSFDDKRTGGTLRTSYNISEPLRQTLRYTLRTVDIFNVKDTASRLIREQQGATTTSLIGQDLVYDVRDNRFEPTEGFLVRLGTDYAGLGGDADYVRVNIGGGIFFKLTPKLVLGLTADAGRIIGIGENVRIADRYFIGGPSLLGFAPSGIGPRDINTRDALGGNQYYATTVELNFPLGLPEELGLNGRVFTNAGSLFDIDTSDPAIKDVGSLRVAVGTGVSWRSPLGPLRVDLTKAVVKESFDKTEFFRFSFGTRF